MNVATGLSESCYRQSMSSSLQTLLLIDTGAGIATLAVFGIIYQSFRSVLIPRRAAVTKPAASERPAYFDRIY
jgi:hypothetical protein